MTILVLDVGNTRLKWAFYPKEKKQIRQKPLAQNVVFLENIETLPEQDWLKLDPPEYIIGCTVAGQGVKQRVEETLELWHVAPSWIVATQAEAGLLNGYEHPNRLGSDRWVAMIGARQQSLSQKTLRPIVVIMVGTAVTIDVIDANGHFLGGVILPGHGLMLKALDIGTAGLHVPTGNVRLFPKNTSDALASGGTYAITGAVRRMVRHVEDHCGITPICYITGGAAWKVLSSIDVTVHLVEHLIFDGLIHIAQERLKIGLPPK